jgi:N-acyl-D-amino-acid deacylase
MMADLVVFDAARITDRSEYAKPHQYSEGIRDLMINGVFVLRDGKMTGDRPGRILYGPGRVN